MFVVGKKVDDNLVVPFLFPKIFVLSLVVWPHFTSNNNYHCLILAAIIDVVGVKLTPKLAVMSLFITITSPLVRF